MNQLINTRLKIMSTLNCQHFDTSVLPNIFLTLHGSADTVTHFSTLQPPAPSPDHLGIDRLSPGIGRAQIEIRMKGKSFYKQYIFKLKVALGWASYNNVSRRGARVKVEETMNFNHGMRNIGIFCDRDSIWIWALDDKHSSNWHWCF